ncbi:DUF3131 domain-containing protein [Longimicrobium sp.]|uniref:DUF3131 domain-containing protein n=1 Tax=Longimicrobium sp. TaxID=2029185 RepID=UPI002CD4B765|nr:DUF3131 domain-containing protein [Longimicrobium sp.]HSU14712.1 DUF3131 domain-containing protein [Longimicrobium sp.]
MMNRVVTFFTLGLLSAGPALCQDSNAAGSGAPAQPRQQTAAAAPQRSSGRTGALNDRDVFMNAARTAWTYIDRQYNRETGLVNSVTGYKYATVWDIGSGLLALYSANQLGLLPDADYDGRMRRALQTLTETGLYDNGAFNKNYHTGTGRVAGRNGQEEETRDGYGWSAIDLGRLLMALKIIAANQPQYAPQAQAIVQRLDFARLVRGGYLQGEDLGPRSRRPRTYQEGRLGYEQYAALGYAAWGHAADRAMRLTTTRPITVLGIPLLADTRGGDLLTSEPFVMYGLEAGWSPEMRDLAWRVLAAQEARYRQTGAVTIVNEDALNGPPYFLYYSVYADGKEFPVAPPEGAPAGPTPRTVSTKGAYGWHALLPSAYTWLAVQKVEGSRTANGWGAGVFEDSGRISGSENVNTAAVILEATLYTRRGGRPLIEASGTTPAPLQ